jgi:hypothetical protein
MRIHHFALCCILLLTGGCKTLGNLNSVHRTLDVSQGNGVLIDIKQRAILVSKDANKKIIVCAEPSPDAMSAYAAEFAAKIDRPEVLSLQGSAGFQEGASFVGLRTSTIQLLRDGMYRLCEAHLNGAIDADSYNLQLRRYQRYMVALLAIEQLTGTQRSPAASIETRGSAQISRDIKKLQAESDQLGKQIDAIDIKLKDAKDNKDSLETEKKALVQRKKDVDAAIQNEREILIEGSTAAKTTPQNVTHQNVTDVTIVATVVKDIVIKILDTDDKPMQCLLYVKHLASDTSKVLIKHEKQDELYNFCTQLLAGNSPANLALKEFVREQRLELISSSDIDADIRSKTLKLLDNIEDEVNVAADARMLMPEDMTP